MKKIYVIIRHCRGRREYYSKYFSSMRKAKKWCDIENSKPEPSMGWGSSYSYEERDLE